MLKVSSARTRRGRTLGRRIFGGALPLVVTLALATDGSRRLDTTRLEHVLGRRAPHDLAAVEDSIGGRICIIQLLIKEKRVTLDVVLRPATVSRGDTPMGLGCQGHSGGGGPVRGP